MAPVFIQEITNGRVQEMDNFTFIASIKGNPKPEITWYCNDRLLQQSQVHQMRIRGDKAMLTVVQASPENKGEYVCRAVNNVGEATCKATLEIIELTYEEKLKIDDERYAALQIQHAAEFMRSKEVERKEKESQEHKVRMMKMSEDRKVRQIEKEKELEDARKNVHKKDVKQKIEKIVKEEVKEEVVYKTPRERRIAEVYSGWKKPVELEKAYPTLEPEQFAPNQVPGVKCFVRVSETSMKGDEVVNEIAPQFFEDEQVIAEIAKVHNLLKNRVRINQIWSMFRAGEFKHLQQPNVQTALVKICEYIGHHRNVSMVLAEETEEQAKTHPVGLKALLRMITHAKDIKQEEFFQEVIPREMGKWSLATQELQKVSQMIKQGIQNEEIIASCEAGKLPSLKRPETQLPLINIVEKQGYTVMVAQVLVEEACRDAKEDRVLAEKAWQVVHEDELVEADVVQVEPEHKAPIKLDIKPAQSIKEEIAVDVVEPFQVDLPAVEHLRPKEEIGYKTHKATVLEVHSEMNIPGFKALVNLATDSCVDLETIDLLPLEKQKYEEDIVKLSFTLKKGVQVEELITMMKEDEFPSLKPAEDQAAILDVVDRYEHAVVNRVLVKECEDRPEKSIGTKSVIKSIETGKQTMEQVIMDVSKEFGPSSQPVREIAAVGQLLQEGVKCSEVLTLLDTGMLPALQKPETQATLVTMVTNKGHISSVCEVLVDESTAELTKELPQVNIARMAEVQDKLIKATAESVNVKTFTKEMVPGVKAYIKMAQEQNVDIQEIVQKSDVKEEIKQEMIKIADMIKHGVVEKDVFSLMEAGEFPEFLKFETQAQLLNVVDDFGHTAIVSDVIIEQAVQQSEQAVGAKAFVRMTEQESVDLERILTSGLPKEIIETQESIEDITKITFMMKQGTPTKDVITMMEAGQLPGLTLPCVQAPLVKVVEREGHTAIVCQVLIEESVKSIQADLPKVDVAKITSVTTVLDTASKTQVLVQEEKARTSIIVFPVAILNLSIDV